MKKLTLIATAVLVAGLVSASSAQYPNNGYLGVYGDLAGTQCCITAAPFTPSNAYLISTLAGLTAGGVTGVEFRVELYPAPDGAYMIQWTANPNLVVALGNPVDETPLDATDPRGCNLSFANCQPVTPGERINWGTLGFVALSATPPEMALRIRQKTPPSSPSHMCPWFVLCDAPVFTGVDMTLTQDQLGGEEPVAFTAYVNKSSCTECGPVAVAPATWSGVKGLFR